MDKDCEQLEPLLAAYSLGALDLEDQINLEAHLHSCPSCLAVLEEYKMVGEGLGASLVPQAPPLHLRARLIAQTSPQPKTPGIFSQLKSFIPRFLQVFAVAAITILVVLNISLLVRVGEFQRTQDLLLRQNQDFNTTISVLTSPGSQIAVLDGEGIQGTLVYDPDGKVAVLNVRGLEDLPEGFRYQVWLVEPDETRVSGGLFRASEFDESTSFIINAPGPLNSFVGVGVTVEPEGGSPGPTGPRVLGTQL